MNINKEIKLDKLNFNTFNDLELKSMAYKNTITEFIINYLHDWLKIKNNKLNLGILGCSLLGGIILSKLIKIEDYNYKLDINVSSRNYEDINKLKFPNVTFFYDNFKLFNESDILILTISKHNLNFVLKDLSRNKNFKEKINKLVIINCISCINSKKLKQILFQFNEFIYFKILTPKINYEIFETKNLILYKNNVFKLNLNAVDEFNKLIQNNYFNILDDIYVYKELLNSFLFFNSEKKIHKPKEILQPINFLNNKDSLFKFIFPKGIKPKENNESPEEIFLKKIEKYKEILEIIKNNYLINKLNKFIKN